MYNKNIIVILKVISIVSIFILSSCGLVQKEIVQEVPLEKNINSTADESQIYLFAARTAQSNKQYLIAIESYKTYIKKNFLNQEKNAEYLFRIFSIYKDCLSDTENGSKVLDQILNSYKEYPAITEHAYIEQIRLYSVKNENIRTVETVKKYINYIRTKKIKGQFLSETCLLAGNSLYKLNKFKESITFLNAMENYSPSPEMLYDCYFLLTRIFMDNYDDREQAYRYVQKLFKTGLKKENYPQVQVMYKKIRWKYLDRKDGLKDDCISSICFDGDDVWFGMWLGGVARFTRSSGRLRIYTSENGLISDFVRDIKIDTENIWIATFEGVSRFDKKSSTWFKYNSIPGISSQKIKSILVTDQYVWFGTLGQGVQRYDKINDTWEDFPDQPQNVVKIKKDPYSDAIIFASLNQGFMIFKSGVWKRFTMKNSAISSDLIKDMAFDIDNIYIATYRNGINAWRRSDGTIRTVDLGKDMPVPYVNTIGINKGIMYLGTLGEGVWIHDMVLGRTERLMIENGLTSNNIMTIEFEKDYIWFGTVDNGVNILYAPALSDKTP
jgi:hypothetical protein